MTYDGASTYAVPQGMGFPIASALDIGRTLDDVAYIDLLIHFDAAPADTPRVGAYFAVFDADGSQIGQHDFPAVIDVFSGEDFSHGAAVARWTAPVPEPATWVLWLGGLAALAARRGRLTPLRTAAAAVSWPTVAASRHRMKSFKDTPALHSRRPALALAAVLAAASALRDTATRPTGRFGAAPLRRQAPRPSAKRMTHDRGGSRPKRLDVSPRRPITD